MKEAIYSFLFLGSILAYYPFSGDASDVTGNGFHGTLSDNGPQLVPDRSGNSNSAYSFDGLADYIVLPEDQRMHFANEPFSINVWYKHHGTVADNEIQSILSAWDSNTGKEFKLGRDWPASKAALLVFSHLTFDLVFHTFTFLVSLLADWREQLQSDTSCSPTAPVILPECNLYAFFNTTAEVKLPARRFCQLKEVE